MLENGCSPEMLPTREIQLRKALSACAGACYDFNVTRDRLIGRPVRIANRMPSHADGYAQLPEECSATQLFAYWGSTLAPEERGGFLAFFSPEHFMDCWRKGEHALSHTYWTRDRNGNSVLAEHSVLLYEDITCGDVLAIAYVRDAVDFGQVKAALLRRREDGARPMREFMLERAGLLQVAQAVFPEIVTINLTKSTYRMVRYYGDERPGLALEGDLRRMLELRESSVAPEDRQSFREAFFPEKLMEAVRQGKKQVQLTYRRAGEDGVYHWITTTVMRQENPYDEELLIVAVSRSVDAEKEREARLQEQVHQQARQLRMQEEELRVTLSRIGSYISYYDVNARTLTTTPQTAEIFGMREVTEDYPESYIANAPEGYPPESAQQLRDFVTAVRRGDPSGSCDYLSVTADGRQVWLRREFVTIFDQEGRPAQAVILSEDVTELYAQTHQQDLDRLGLIRAGETVFPEMVAINLTKGHYRMVRRYEGTLALPAEGPVEEMLDLRLSYVAPEDQEAFRRNFYPQPLLEAFERGRDRMQLTYRRIGPDGVSHWMETMAVRQDNPYNDDLLVFAVTRNVDEQKQQEERLQQALAASIDKFDGWQYYNRLSSQTYVGLTYVDYPDGRPSPYVVGGLARRLDCPEKELVLGTCFRIPEEDRGAVQLAFERSRQAGRKTFQADYRIETDRGETVWIHNHATRFTDKNGEAGYIHFLTDITQERALLDQLKAHMEERLKESEQIFNIVAQHSNRVLYEYDPSSGSIHPWNRESAQRDALSQLYTGASGEETWSDYRGILPESLEEAKRFFADIRGGVPSGQAKLHLRLRNGALKWYHFHHTSMFNGESLGTVLVSVEDITESHEHEIAYLSHRQAIDNNVENYLIYMEACMTCNRVEALSGKAAERQKMDLTRPYMELGEELMRSLFLAEDLAEAVEYFSCRNLMELYERGEHALNSTWGARSHDGVQQWVNVRVTLIADPYNGHIKAFIRAMDITREHEKQTSLVQQAETDTMTGLLRRGVGEARIRGHLSAHAQPGGILAVLDLDDLKGINDTLGHAQGDRAIVGIAETLKRHFRKDDLLVRAGGDEFLIFLPGAGKSICAVEQSMYSLLQKLSLISLGENGEQAVRCSIGCAVELPETDTFDSLYQRADIALYHIKRGGKNNVAFFEPEMLEESYRMKVKQAVPVVASEGAGSGLQKLLEVVSLQYPGVVQFELTRDIFRIMSVGGNVAEVPEPDRVDIFWENWRVSIHPDDWADTFSTLCREGLLKAYAQGKRRFSHYYRNREERGYVRTEVDIRFYAGANGEVGAFLLFRWDPDSGEAGSRHCRAGGI